MCLLNQNCASWSTSTIRASAIHLANISGQVHCAAVALPLMLHTVTVIIHTSSQHAILSHQLSHDNLYSCSPHGSEQCHIGSISIGPALATTAASSSAV